MKAATILALSAACAFHGASARSPSMPSEADLVQGQGAHARAELSALSAVYAMLPAAAAREAFDSGNAVIDWGHWSPGLVGINRGPTLSESLYPLLSNIAAAKASCQALEGPCQKRANTWAASKAKTILASPHPGKALSETLEEK